MPLDTKTALQRLDNDTELYRKICNIFQEETPCIVRMLKISLQNNEYESATRYAHSIKSTAANIGATDLFIAAKNTEQACRTGSTSDVTTLLQSIDRTLQQVLSCIETANISGTAPM